MVAQAGQQDGSPDGVVDRVHPTECNLQQPNRRLDGAGEVSRVGCSSEQVNAVKFSRPGGVGHPLPELQGTLIVALGLGEGVGLLGGQPGLGPCRQGAGKLPSRIPMDSQLSGGHGRRSGR